MRVVIDSNIFVMCLTSRSPFHHIYKDLEAGKFNLLINTEISLEYFEIVQYKYGVVTAKLFAQLLRESKSVIDVRNYFKWNLVINDADDNKYVDCFVSGNADYLVTEDRHFNILKSIPFPKINVLTWIGFLKFLKMLGNIFSTSNQNSPFGG